VRTLVHLDGATLLGEGSVGGLRLSLPGLLLDGIPSWDPPSGLAELPRIEELSGPGPMQRRLRLRRSEALVDLQFLVPTPEVTGGGEAPSVAGERCLLVRTPLSDVARERLTRDPWDLVIWSNARASFQESERFVREAVDLRETSGPGPMLWAPRVATPGRLALLFSLGIDLLDTTQGLWEVAEGASLAADSDDLETTDERSAPLPGRFDRLAEEYRQELERVRRFARAGRLRELVEARLVSEPRRGELLRYFDRSGYAFQESHAPVTGEGVRPFTTKEALRRPGAERFRRRFLERYHPPSVKRTLLLVPCSKTKPYARSPTHRRIARALEGVHQPWSIHTVSVTSPLGLVPRELEAVYPACHYDIPVTGDWDEDERRWVREALRFLLASHRYANVVAHLPREEYAWLADLLPPGDRTLWTVVGESTTSTASLGSLTQALHDLPPEPSPLPRGGVLRLIREELQVLAAFQFSPALAEALFAGEVRLAGRPWFQRLVSPEKEDLATWKEETGVWRLTVAGARRVLAAAAGNRVEVRGGVELRGDLFAPGVASADAEVRIGSDVVLVREGAVLGVGEASVPGPWMGRLARGRVVRVRHRAHPSTPRPPGTAPAAASTGP
jgi:archaeosine synthase alpha-subunit